MEAAEKNDKGAQHCPGGGEAHEEHMAINGDCPWCGSFDQSKWLDDPIPFDEDTDDHAYGRPEHEPCQKGTTGCSVDHGVASARTQCLTW